MASSELRTHQAKSISNNYGSRPTVSGLLQRVPIADQFQRLSHSLPSVPQGGGQSPFVVDNCLKLNAQPPSLARTAAPEFINNPNLTQAGACRSFRPTIGWLTSARQYQLYQHWLVLYLDITTTVEIGVEFKTTLPALETRLRATIGTMNMTTTRTALRCLAWVNPNDHTTLRLCFVSKQIPQTVERPLVHSTLLLLATLFRIRADFLQVLNDDQSARSYRLNQLPTDNVVAIRPKPSRLARQLFEMSFGRLRAFGLKRTLQPEIPAFHCFPGTLTEKFVVGGDGRTGDPEVHTDDFSTGNELYVWKSHHHMKPEPAFAIDQVSTIKACTLLQQANSIRIQVQRQHLPALSRCQRNAISIDGIRTLVISNGTVCTLGATHWFEDWSRLTTRDCLRNLLGIFSFPFHIPRQRRLDRFCRFRSGRNYQLSGQLWIVCAQWIVSRLVQFYTILFPSLPTVHSNCIEAGRILLHGFRQNCPLFLCGQKWKTDRALHKAILAQIF